MSELSLYVQGNEDERPRALMIRSAALGYREAQSYLAIHLTKEDKFVESHKQMIVAAAIGGCAESQFQVAANFHKGSGTKVDPGKAFSYASKSAENRYPAAFDLLGVFYKLGISSNVQLI
jgi:TPR repeat protein